MESRVLILNPDPVFEDRLLSIFDLTDGTEIRIVRSVSEAVAVLIAESFDGFVIEGEPEFAVDAATVARQHFPSLKLLCAPWERPSSDSIRKAQQQKIPLANGAGSSKKLGGEGPDHFWVDELYVSADGPPTSGVHLAFQANDRAAVDRFHAAALRAGGLDNGRPGIRDYGAGYYAAYVRAVKARL